MNTLRIFHDERWMTIEELLETLPAISLDDGLDMFEEQDDWEEEPAPTLPHLSKLSRLGIRGIEMIDILKSVDEPVAWQYCMGLDVAGDFAWTTVCSPEPWRSKGLAVRGLYIRPQPAAPLTVTDEDARNAFDAYMAEMRKLGMSARVAMRVALESFANRINQNANLLARSDC